MYIESSIYQILASLKGNFLMFMFFSRKVNICGFVSTANDFINHVSSWKMAAESKEITCKILEMKDCIQEKISLM